MRSSSPGAAHLLGIGAHGRLHGQGRIAGPHGVVFMRNGGTKQRHNAIASTWLTVPSKRCTASIMRWRPDRGAAGRLRGRGRG